MSEMSTEIGELATALAAAQARFQPAVKSKMNPHFKSTFADLDDCWNAVRTGLTENGLSVVQQAKAEGNQVSVNTLLLHKSGQWISATLTVASRDPSPQAIGSAITYARRYGFSAIVGITTDEDDDGNASSPPPSQQARRPAPPPKFDAGLPAHANWVRKGLAEVFPSTKVSEATVTLLTKSLQGQPLTRETFVEHAEKILTVMEHEQDFDIPTENRVT